VEDHEGKTGWICNTCRFDKKNTSDWVIDGPSKVSRHSVISANHYNSVKALKASIEKQRAALPHGEKVTLGHGALDPNNENK
jgi:NADH-quinone oxidoreductase subunit G